MGEFILDTDKMLISLLWNILKTNSDATGISDQNQIALSAPNTAQAAGAKVSVFLYNINRTDVARNSPATDASGRKTHQTGFALSYLITPCSGEDENDHLLLGRIVQILENNPVLYESKAGSDSNLRVKVDSLSIDNLTNLWIALNTPLKASISCTISQTTTNLEGIIEIATPPTTSNPLVNDKATEIYQTVFKTYSEQAEGWKKRNMLQKQFVFQDFKRTTDMSVDEMLTALNGLGDKLETGRPTSQFIKPLNALAEFYEHQRDILKGATKFSQKQKENIETIDGWVQEVKALLEALGALS
jgi:Pvc16 N-terminal domain